MSKNDILFLRLQLRELVYEARNSCDDILKEIEDLPLDYFESYSSLANRIDLEEATITLEDLAYRLQNRSECRPPGV